MSDSESPKITNASDQTPLILQSAKRATEIDSHQSRLGIELHIEKKIQQALFWIVSVVLAAAIGAAVSMMWELNGKVNNAVGRSEIFDKLGELDRNLSRLETEKFLLKKSIACLKDNGIKDKAVCNYEH